jgi:hypothetical protein
VNECPRCSGAVADGQEYCLECGARLPGNGGIDRPRDLGQGWIVRSLLALGIALVGATAAIAATDDTAGPVDVLTATGGFVTAPATETDTDTTPSSDVPLPTAEWPPGDDGWTISLASLPQTEGRRAAERRAQDARRAGLRAVGILDSSQYASLHPGYWIVFTGVYGSAAEASSALPPARRFARTATVRRVVP